MQSRSLALGVLAVACVAAAGGGAYLATLQHARSQAAASQAAATTQAQQSQPPIVATQPQTPSIAVPESAPEAAPTAPPSQKAESVAPRPAPVAAAKPAPPKPAPTKTSEGSVSRPADPNAPPPASAVVPVPTPPADQAVPVQRPWPGPPASAQQPPISLADPSRAEGTGVKLWEEMVVPSESVLGLQLETALSTEYARVEDRVDARLTRDVRVSGRVAIPSGSRIVGSVVLVERGGKMKDRARIGIKFNTLMLADGARVPITTDTVYREGESPGNKASAKIGGAAIGGAIIGAILGGGKGAAIGSGIGAAGGTAAAMNGDRIPVILPVGTTVSVRTQAPITVTVEK